MRIKINIEMANIEPKNKMKIRIFEAKIDFFPIRGFENILFLCKILTPVFFTDARRELC